MILERIYIDSSAVYALMDRADKYHEPARSVWPALLEDGIGTKGTYYDFMLSSTWLALTKNALGLRSEAVNDARWMIASLG